MQTLTLSNFGPANLKEQTRLSNKVAVGSTGISVANTQGFSSGDTVLIGQRGDDSSEVVVVNGAPVDATINLVQPLNRTHVAYEYVTKLFGDRMKVYRAANVNGAIPADSNFALLTTLDIDFDQMSTDYTDLTGGSDYWYKFTYYNSASSTETSLADSTPARGGGADNYVGLIDIRKEAGFEYATYVSDEDIDSARKAAQAEVNGSLSGVYTVPFKQPVNDWIVDITKRLAAGLLLQRQYGTMGASSNINGSKKIEQARQDLKSLANKQSVLTDSDGNNTSLPGSIGGVSGWPDDTADLEGEPRQFAMKDIHGYIGRKW